MGAIKGMNEPIVLSILIPYYNAEQYIGELLAALRPQIRKNVEVLLCDDGSDKPFKTRYQWIKVIRQDNKGGAAAKNTLLNNAKGEYIAFIDADDLIPPYYVEKLLKEIERSKADVIDFSWKSLTKGGTQFNYKLRKSTDRLKNCSVCTRSFKKSYLGKLRLNENKDATYDEDYSRRVGFLVDNHKHSSITDYMYYYRTAIDDSSIHKFKQGLKHTKRIVYHYEHVTKNMGWLLDEIKEEDESNEVWLITNQNEIPELSRYCQIASDDVGIWGHVLRGEPYSKFTLIMPPIKTDILIYTEYMNVVGGMATWLYNTCQVLKQYYSITIMYDKFPQEQIDRLSKVVSVVKNVGQSISCDSLIVSRLTDKIPGNVIYNKSIQMCHACKQKIIQLKNECDYLVNVSQASKDSWGDASKDGIVIRNLSYVEADELLLVSATRMQVGDKGDNDKRFRQLANMLNEKGIKFTWLNFSDKGLIDPPVNFINAGAKVNVQNIIKRADYLVQLSDQEACPFVVIEALSLNTPILATPFESLFELGFVDGKTGYVIPYDMDFDVGKLLNIPKFNFKYDNETIINQWKELLSKPPLPADTKIKVMHDYYDLKLKKMQHRGDVLMVKKRRAIELAQNENKIIKILN